MRLRGPPLPAARSPSLRRSDRPPGRAPRRHLPVQRPRELTDELSRRAGIAPPTVRVVGRRPKTWSNGRVTAGRRGPVIHIDARLLNAGEAIVAALLGHEIAHLVLHRAQPVASKRGEKPLLLAAIGLGLPAAILLVFASMPPVDIGWVAPAIASAAFVGAVAAMIRVLALQAPERQARELEADLYAIRLLGERESTIALLERSRRPLQRGHDGIARRFDAHPPLAVRLAAARSAELPDP